MQMIDLPTQLGSNSKFNTSQPLKQRVFFFLSLQNEQIGVHRNSGAYVKNNFFFCMMSDPTRTQGHTWDGCDTKGTNGHDQNEASFAMYRSSRSLHLSTHVAGK